MDQQALQKLKNTLQQADSLGIIVGQNPTVDEMGAALSLYLAFKTAQKKVSIVSATEPIVEHSSLVGIDQVRNTLGSGAAGDLVVSFPYREGEIEKVSYTLENGYLNIVVKAGELGLNFQDEDVQFNRGGGATPSVIITVGVPTFQEIEHLVTPSEGKEMQIINIDNRQNNQGYGAIVIVSPRMSSVSEIVAEILLSTNMPIDVDIAQNILSGITTATTNFQDQKTSFLAFEMAGEMLRLGAVRLPTIAPTSSQMASIPTQRPQPRYQAMNNPMEDYGAGTPQVTDRGQQMPNRGQQQRPQQRPQNQMRQQQRPQGGQRSQGGHRSSQMPQNSDRGQDRGGQRRTSGPSNQPQRQQFPDRNQDQHMNQPQPQIQQRSRQDEIREELARAARQQAAGQMYGNDDQLGQPEPGIMPEPQPESITQPEPQRQQNGRSQNPPADWLTPKVYKGSTDVNN